MIITARMQAPDPANAEITPVRKPAKVDFSWDH